MASSSCKLRSLNAPTNAIHKCSHHGAQQTYIGLSVFTYYRYPIPVSLEKVEVEERLAITL